MSSPPDKMNILLKQLKKTHEKQKLNFSSSALFHMKSKVSLKYFVNNCLWKHFLASNLNSLTMLVTLRPFTSFNLKLEQSSCKKVLKFALLGNCFSDLLTEVKIWY